LQIAENKAGFFGDVIYGAIAPMSLAFLIPFRLFWLPCSKHGLFFFPPTSPVYRIPPQVAVA